MRVFTKTRIQKISNDMKRIESDIQKLFDSENMTEAEADGEAGVELVSTQYVLSEAAENLDSLL